MNLFEAACLQLSRKTGEGFISLPLCHISQVIYRLPSIRRRYLFYDPSLIIRLSDLFCMSRLICRPSGSIVSRRHDSVGSSRHYTIQIHAYSLSSGRSWMTEQLYWYLTCYCPLCLTYTTEHKPIPTILTILKNLRKREWLSSFKNYQIIAKKTRKISGS